MLGLFRLYPRKMRAQQLMRAWIQECSSRIDTSEATRFGSSLFELTREFLNLLVLQLVKLREKFNCILTT
jgi:hypothetical protein